jgi:hypothetical protein
MTVQEAVAFLFQQKEGPWSCLQPVFASHRNNFLGAGS